MALELMSFPLLEKNIATSQMDQVLDLRLKIMAHLARAGNGSGCVKIKSG